MPTRVTARATERDNNAFVFMMGAQTMVVMYRTLLLDVPGQRCGLRCKGDRLLGLNEFLEGSST